VAGARHGHPGRAGQQAAQELPDLATVAQEEEEGEQDDEEPGEHLGEGRGGAQRARCQGAHVRADGLAQLVHALAELGVGQVQRASREPGLHLRDTLADLGGQVVAAFVIAAFYLTPIGWTLVYGLTRWTMMNIWGEGPDAARLG
jgi:hypothetical protein